MADGSAALNLVLGGWVSAGVRLREMVGRAGYSLDRFARACNFRAASSIQRYVDREREFIPFDVVERFVGALVGRGTPPITREEVYALSGVNPIPNHRQHPYRNAGMQNAHTDIAPAPEALNLRYMERDLPIRGEARGDAEYFFGDGMEALATTLRPSYLASVPSAYAVYMHGSLMVPRFRPGELLFIDPVRPAAAGDDVVIQLRNGLGYVRELVERTLTEVVCRGHNPPEEIRFPANQVRSIHLVIGATRIRA